MIHEIFGLDDVMRRHADHLAGLGYLTLAVDLFSSGGTARCLVSTMTAMMRGHGRAFADISAARDYLTGSIDCTGKIGVIGFCMGGGFALLSAHDGYDAAAVNYGQLPRDLDAAVAEACPIVASYGRRDPSLRGAAGRLEVALETAGVTHDVKEYPHASHAFLNDAEAGTPAASSAATRRGHRSRTGLGRRRLEADRGFFRSSPAGVTNSSTVKKHSGNGSRYDVRDITLQWLNCHRFGTHRLSSRAGSPRSFHSVSGHRLGALRVHGEADGFAISASAEFTP